MRYLSVLVAAGALVLPAIAAADEVPSGIYIEGRGGAVFVEDSDLDSNLATGEVSFDTGWAAEGALGYAHESGLRGDLSFGYREADTDEITVNGVGTFDIEDEATILSGLANVYYDLYLKHLGVDGPVGSKLALFVGGGAGIANVEFGSDDDTVFAYQGSAGISYAFNKHVGLNLRYSYFATSDPEFDNVDAEFSSHNILAGVRVTF